MHILSTSHDCRFDHFKFDLLLCGSEQHAIQFTFWLRVITISILTISGRRRPLFDLTYDKTVVDVLDSSESGIIRPSLLRLIDKMNFNEWKHGEAITHVIDCRFSSIKKFHILGLLHFHLCCT
jgi:hypothetical protein